MAKSKTNSTLAERELDKAEKQFDDFDKNIKEMTLDRMNEASTKETEQQTKIAQSDRDKMKDVYLKPKRSLPPGVNPKTGEKEKFNEKFRSDYEFAKEYVQFVAENKEIIGEAIETWTKPFPGMNCEFWEVPTNKPVWGPRYLAERISGCKYHRFQMQDNLTNSSDGRAQFYGTMAVDTTIQRLDAIPVSQRKSIFMGSNKF